MTLCLAGTLALVPFLVLLLRLVLRVAVSLFCGALFASSFPLFRPLFVWLLRVVPLRWPSPPSLPPVRFGCAGHLTLFPFLNRAQQRLRPCVGHRPLHHAAPVVLVPGGPLLSWLLHYAWPHVTTPVAGSAACVPIFFSVAADFALRLGPNERSG